MRWLAVCFLLSAATCSRPAPAPKPEPEPVLEPAPVEPDLETQLEQALASEAEGDRAAARAKLDELRESSPSFALAALERAELLIASGAEFELALEDASFATEALPDNPRAWKLLGQAHDESGATTEAIEAYRRSLALRQDNRLGRRLAFLEKQAGHLDEALRLWESVRAQEPDDLGARLELADLYERTGRPASAKAEWKEVERLAPGNVHLLRRFADFLERQGLLAEARGVRERVDELSPARDERKLRPLLPSRR